MFGAQKLWSVRLAETENLLYALLPLVLCLQSIVGDLFNPLQNIYVYTPLYAYVSPIKRTINSIVPKQ